jgi:hypothetical protein
MSVVARRAKSEAGRKAFLSTIAQRATVEAAAEAIPGPIRTARADLTGTRLRHILEPYRDYDVASEGDKKLVLLKATKAI